MAKQRRTFTRDFKVEPVKRFTEGLPLSVNYFPLKGSVPTPIIFRPGGASSTRVAMDDGKDSFQQLLS
jgi:hypothetical protein